MDTALRTCYGRWTEILSAPFICGLFQLYSSIDPTLSFLVSRNSHIDYGHVLDLGCCGSSPKPSIEVASLDSLGGKSVSPYSVR